MRSSWNKVFGSGLLGMAVAVSAGAQTKPSAAIPATQPTSTPSVSDLPSAHPSATSSGASVVTWSNAQLTVEGHGDDLRGVLLQVARLTGMKVTGGIPDERVFGNYGPGPVQQVLGQLFDGIAINMMLVNGGPTTPKELVLTARTGGVTPPMARPIGDDEGSRYRSGARSGFNNQPNAAQLPPGQAAPQQQPPPPPPAGAAVDISQPASTTPTTDASGQPQSPNGVRTPEQIFEELQKRQQQQKSGASGTSQ